MLKYMAWIGISMGYYGVDGKEFRTYEECRAYMINRFEQMVQKYGNVAMPDGWSCKQVEFIRDNRTIEEREIK